MYFFILSNKNTAIAQCGPGGFTDAFWYNGAMPSNTVPALIFSGINNKSYKEISNIVSGGTYRFTISCRWYITIRKGSNVGSSVVVAHGYAPVEFVAPAGPGNYYVFFNEEGSNCNAGSSGTQCGDANMVCLDCPGTPPAPLANEFCYNAVPFCVGQGALDYTLQINAGTATDEQGTNNNFGCLTDGSTGPNRDANPGWFYVENNYSWKF